MQDNELLNDIATKPERYSLALVELMLEYETNFIDGDLSIKNLDRYKIGFKKLGFMVEFDMLGEICSIKNYKKPN